MWKQYRDNAADKLGDADLLLAKERFGGAYESAFFAIEIALKACMVRSVPALAGAKTRQDARAAGVPPGYIAAYFAHDIGLVLDTCTALDGALRVGLQAEYILLRQFAADGSYWVPWKRYFGKIEKDLAHDLFNLAKALQVWMLSNSLKE